MSFKGFGGLRFTGTVSGGRPLLTTVTTRLPPNVIPAMIEGTQWNDLHRNGTYSISGTDLSITGEVDFNAPNDWLRGTYMQPVSPYTLQMGAGFNAVDFRDRASPPVNNGMAMGYYNPYFKYTDTNSPSSESIRFRSRGLLAVPETRIISRMFYLKDTTKDFLPAVPVGPGLLPQGDVLEEEPIVDDKNCPIGCPPDAYLGPSTVVGPANQVYFGEQISSWRQMLKRYFTIGHITPAAANTTYVTVMPAMPFESGAPGAFFTKTVGNTILLYITNAYVCARGGGRYIYAEHYAIPTTANAFAAHNRETSEFTGIVNSVGTLTSLSPRWSGSVCDDVGRNPSSCVEIPYYSNRRFIPPRSRTAGNNLVQRPNADFVYTSQGVNPKSISWSAAEDFSLAFFLSVPPFLWGPAT